MFDTEKTKSVTTIIQNITLTVAVIVGGIWTLYTFRSLGQEEKAKYELIGKPSLNINIEVTKTAPTSTDSYAGLIIEVCLENKGTRYLKLRTLDSVLCVSKIQQMTNAVMTSSENIYLEPIMSYHDSQHRILMSNIQIQPNSKKIISYFCEISSSGIYFISFNSTDSKKTYQELESLSDTIDNTKLNADLESLHVKKPESISNWFAAKYIEIK